MIICVWLTHYSLLNDDEILPINGGHSQKKTEGVTGSHWVIFLSTTGSTTRTRIRAGWSIIRHVDFDGFFGDDSLDSSYIKKCPRLSKAPQGKLEPCLVSYWNDFPKYGQTWIHMIHHDILSSFSQAKNYTIYSKRLKCSKSNKNGKDLHLLQRF